MCRLPPLRTHDSRRNFAAYEVEFNPNGQVFARTTLVGRCAVGSARHRQLSPDARGGRRPHFVRDPKSSRGRMIAPRGALERPIRRPLRLGVKAPLRRPHSRERAPTEARISLHESRSHSHPPRTVRTRRPRGSRQRDDPRLLAPRAWAVHA